MLPNPEHDGGPTKRPPPLVRRSKDPKLGEKDPNL